jgi:hypothetical protein
MPGCRAPDVHARRSPQPAATQLLALSTLGIDISEIRRQADASDPAIQVLTSLGIDVNALRQTVLSHIPEA